MENPFPSQERYFSFPDISSSLAEQSSTGGFDNPFTTMVRRRRSIPPFRGCKIDSNYSFLINNMTKQCPSKILPILAHDDPICLRPAQHFPGEETSREWKFFNVEKQLRYCVWEKTNRGARIGAVARGKNSPPKRP